MEQKETFEEYLLNHKEKLNNIIRQYPMYRKLEDMIKKYE